MGNVNNLEGLDLLDLISESHIALRDKHENMSSEQLPEIKLGSSEWYVISQINEGKPTYRELNNKISLTRQAVHKLIKQLENKNIVITEPVEGNKKEKCVYLTEYGLKCYQIYKATKDELLNHLKDTLGTDKYLFLEQILKEDFNLSNIE